MEFQDGEAGGDGEVGGDGWILQDRELGHLLVYIDARIGLRRDARSDRGYAFIQKEFNSTGSCV